MRCSRAVPAPSAGSWNMPPPKRARPIRATRDEAIAYAAKNGIEVEVMPTPVRTLKIQAYADNFR